MRATVEQIEPEIMKFVGSSGGGQWNFQLQCKCCEDLVTVSAKKHSIGNPKALKKAAKKFTEQGWRSDGKQLICPTCYKRKFT